VGSDDLDVTVDHRRDGVVVVHPAGRLDLLYAAELRQRLADLVAAGESRLVVNLARVISIDSAGLGALFSGLKAARRAGGDLRIASPPDQALVILELTMLRDVLRTYPTEAEALHGF
jgi:anti-anti-sigma factor